VVIVTWSCLLFVRTDGLDSSLKSHVKWRWTPTSEEVFLAQKQSNSRTASVTGPAAAPSTPQAHSNDSPAFRGNNRDGVIHGTKVDTNWKDVSPKQLWKHAVGPAWSSVIVVGDRLYTQEQRGPMEAVVCYDSATGNEVWSHEDATRFDEGVSGPGPRATPSFADGRILALGGTGILNCLDAATGKVNWSRDIKNDAQSKPPLWGFSSSPLIVDKKVIVYGGGVAGKGLLAYRLESGELAWTADLGQSSYSSPQMTTIGGVKQCLMLHDGGLTGIDPATGKKLWETGLVMRGAPRCGQPHLVGENRVAVAILDGPGISLIDVSKKGDAWNVSPVWASKDLKPEFPDFVVHEGKAYGFDVSIFCCLDLATGKRVWKEGRFGRGQVILLEDQALLLVISESGDAVLLTADGKEEKELGRIHALNGKTWNDPTIANGRLYVRNAEEMACYLIEPGQRTANR
jgi:outer membrane protein assembly factor BamB